MGWQKIKNEYIAGEATLQELATKYDVSFSTIQKKSMEEKWGNLRKKKRRKTEERIIDAVAQKEAKRATNIVDVADKLIGKIAEILDASKPLNTQNIKNLTSALQDLAKIKGFKSEADMREQEARIKNLEKQAMADDNELTEIRVTFGDGEGESGQWAE